MAPQSTLASKLPDLTMCDVEPITRLDTVQDFGFLIALTNDWNVVRVSANLACYWGVEAATVLGKNFSSLITPAAELTLRGLMASIYANGSERVMNCALVDNRAPFDLNIHIVGELVIVEGEPANPDDEQHGMASMRGVIKRLLAADSLEIFHRLTARQVRTLTGYDRVMIYRFDPQGNGEVIAESVRSGIETFIGLHYPASDIPQQARALYLVNPFRIIADVGASTAALLPALSAVTGPLDMTHCITRSVSPVHLEYLQNMGVKATLSISIIVSGELWGLIVCHHYTPRLPTLAQRTAAELFGTMYSLSLCARLQTNIASEEVRTHALADKLINAIAGNKNLLTDAQWLQDMTRDMIDYDGVAICQAGTIFASGSVPDEGVIRLLIEHLNATSPSRVFTTDCLASINPAFVEARETAAGVLAIPISRSPRDYILMFRRERMRSIQWGGDPAKSVAADSSQRLSPRKSFAAFAEIVRGKALPFDIGEQRSAEAVRSAMVEVILRLSEAHNAALAASDVERRQAVEALREGEKFQAIGQLAGGIAHDFNNILQQVFFGTALLRVSGNTEERRLELLDMLDLAAHAARESTARLLAFGRRQVLKPAAIDLNALIGELAVFLRPSLGLKVDLKLDLDSEPCWAMIDAGQLKVAILTMATNARDAMLPDGGIFTLQTIHSTINRSGGAAVECVCINVTDTGHGMSAETLSHIFEPFYTTKQPGMGTGLGLAQVWGFAMQSNASISATSRPGQGTTFSLLMPKLDHVKLVAPPKALPGLAIATIDQPMLGKTILVVEDDGNVADVTISLLANEGYVTHYAATADEALAILDSGKPIDAVFSDVVMPGSINGVQLAAAIRSRHPKIAITLASGYAEFLADGADVGTTEVLGKPYRFTDLTTALTRAFAAVA